MFDREAENQLGARDHQGGSSNFDDLRVLLLTVELPEFFCGYGAGAAARLAGKRMTISAEQPHLPLWCLPAAMIVTKADQKQKSDKVVV